MHKKSSSPLRSAYIIAAAVLLPALFLMTPARAQGQVIISEIAWMGSLPDAGETTAQAANDEWIELFNAGNEMVSLAGWTLQAKDGMPVIQLSGSVTPGGHFLLARNNATVSSVAADLVYPYKDTALENGGEHLQLFNESGALIDEVDGGAAWNGNGDNVTKQTMERSSVAGFWGTSVSAGGTPRAQNSIWETPAPSPSPPSPPSEFPPPPPPSPSEPFPPPPPPNNTPPYAVISVAALTARTGEEVLFDGSDSSDPDGDTLSFLWDFGDGTLTNGAIVTHRFSNEGSFLVTLTVRDTHNESGAASQTFTVTPAVYADTVKINEILPDPFGADADGEFIELANEGDEEIALGGWTLDDAEDAKSSRPWTIPALTLIPPKGFLIFTRRETSLAFNNSGDSVRLLAPNGSLKDSVSYEQAPEGQSFAHFEKEGWVWTITPTANAQNILTTQEEPPESAQANAAQKNDAEQEDETASAPTEQRPVPEQTKKTAPSTVQPLVDHSFTASPNTSPKSLELESQRAQTAKDSSPWGLAAAASIIALAGAVGAFMLRRLVREAPNPKHQITNKSQ